MQCPNCTTFADPGTVFCGQCGFQITGATQPQTLQKSQGAVARPQVIAPVYPWTPSPLNEKTPVYDRRLQHTSPQNQISEPLSGVFMPSTYVPMTEVGGEAQQTKKRNKSFLMIILVLLLIGIIAGLFAIWQNMHILQNHVLIHQMRLVMGYGYRIK